MKQKHPFILIEVFLAIALLSLCAFPVIGSSFKSYQCQKEQLLTLELDRQAELYFYQLLKEDVEELRFHQISSQPSMWTPFPVLHLSLGEVTQTYYPHYHLYYAAQSKSLTHKKLFCRICFPTKKGICPNSRGRRGKRVDKKSQYIFCFLVKKVAEN